MSYQPKVYRHAGGDQITVASGGTLNIDGTWKIGGTAVTASAASLNTAGGAVTNLDVGADGTAGTLDVFPATATNGKLTITATDNGGARNVNITNDAVAATRSLKIPDPGGDGKFVMTTAANSLLVNANGSNRTMSLSGNVSAAAGVTLGGALTTAAAVEFSGAFAAVVAVPSASTWTLPTGGGTLALATGAETGTTSSTFTVDSDSATGKLLLRTNSVAGTNHTVTVQAPTTTQNVTLTLPDVATDTVCAIAATQTLAAKTLTTPVINGATTAAAANNFDLSTGTGTFKTPTGVFTHYGNVANNGNITFDFSGSNGTFKTSTGAVTIGGNTTISDGKTFVIGSATGGPTAGVIEVFSATAAKGSIKLKQADDANNKITTIQSNNAAANATITLPNATATLATIGLAESLDLKTLTNAGDITQTGATTITSGTTGIIIPDANTAGLSIHASAAQGSIRIKAAPMGADTILDITNEAQTQATTFKIPDLNVAASQFVCTNADQTCTVVTGAADRTVTLSGNLNIAANLTTTTAAVTLAANAAGSSVTLPASGTLATLAAAETLSNKVIDGDDNTVRDLAGVSPKAGVVGVRGGAVPVPGLTFALNFDMDNTAGVVTYTNNVDPQSRTFKVLDCWGVKTDATGGAGDTVQVGGSGGVITEAASLNTIADVKRFAFTDYDDSKTVIANAATLTVTTVKGGATNCQCEVTVLCMWL